jgi:hypothetical protein
MASPAMTHNSGAVALATSLDVLALGARPVSLAEEQILPVLPPLMSLLPEGGLRRGTVTAISGGTAAVSLAMALVVAAVSSGRWMAVVGAPGTSNGISNGRDVGSALGLSAAREMGLSLERLVMVDVPPPDRVDAGYGTEGAGIGWATVVAACLDAFEVVLTWPPRRASSSDGRRLAARLRERGSVMLTMGDGPFQPDLRLEAIEAMWTGLGHGHGHLRERRVTIEAMGRRGASRPRRSQVLLPDADGALAIIEPMGAVASLNARAR